MTTKNLLVEAILQGIAVFGISNANWMVWQ